MNKKLVVRFWDNGPCFKVNPKESAREDGDEITTKEYDIPVLNIFILSAALIVLYKLTVLIRG